MGKRKGKRERDDGPARRNAAPVFVLKRGFYPEMGWRWLWGFRRQAYTFVNEVEKEGEGETEEESGSEEPRSGSRPGERS